MVCFFMKGKEMFNFLWVKITSLTNELLHMEVYAQEETYRCVHVNTVINKTHSCLQVYCILEAILMHILQTLIPFFPG